MIYAGCTFFKNRNNYHRIIFFCCNRDGFSSGAGNSFSKIKIIRIFFLAEILIAEELRKTNYLYTFFSRFINPGKRIFQIPISS